MAMRNIFEKYAARELQLAPQHSAPGAVFFSQPVGPHLPAAYERELGLGAGSQGAAQGQTAASPSGQDAQHSSAGSSSSGQAAVAAAGSMGTSSGTSAGPATAQQQPSDSDGGETESDSAPDNEAEPGDADDDYETLDSKWALSGWLRDNPIGTPTEREHHVQQQGLPVYRVLLHKA